MKKSTLTFLILGVSILLTSLVSIANYKSHLPPTPPRGKALYASYCADCHGKKLETFAAKEDWLFGNEDGDLFTSIKYGREIMGMPAYGEVLSDQQINRLVSFIKANEGNVSIPESPQNLTRSNVQKFKVTTLTDSSEYGELLWGIDFLPSGEMLLTDKSGTLHFGVPGEPLTKVSNMPPHILSMGQSGLMDVMVHPEYAENGFVYLSFTEEKPNDDDKKQLVVIRAVFDEDLVTLKSKKEIFRAKPGIKHSHHLGARMVIDKEGYLFIASGERGSNEKTQELNNHYGKMIRLFDDGRIPKDNPFINTPDALPEIWTLGHRNPQGMIVHPETNALYAHEHGPKGGDEINLIEPGKNYGWPSILFGINYDGKPISADTAKAGMEQPLYYWLPSIAPCGMEFVTGNTYPSWAGDLLIGSLKFKYLARCSFQENGKVTEVERLLEGIGRIRSVKADPNGYIYVVTEKPGAVHRLDPM